MLLTRKEVFKRDFIKQCAAEGLTDEGQVLDRIFALLNEKQGNQFARLVNQFNEKFHKSQVPDAEGNYGPSPVLPAAAAMIVAPGAIGAGMGMLGSKLKGNWLDEEDVKNQELIEELRRQTQLARQFHRMGGAAPSSF